VISALEAMVHHRTDRAEATRFAAIANCGFPEGPSHDTALAICEQFRRRAGYDYAGGLALGAGEGLVTVNPHPNRRPHHRHQNKPSTISATALAAGQPIPAESEKPSWHGR